MCCRVQGSGFRTAGSASVCATAREGTNRSWGWHIYDDTHAVSPLNLEPVWLRLRRIMSDHQKNQQCFYDQKGRDSDGRCPGRSLSVRDARIRQRDQG